MRKIRKEIKILFFIILLSIILLIFLLNIFKTKSYSVEYDLDGFEISENYDSKQEIYYYELKKDNIKYNFVYESKYIKNDKLIKNIKEYKKEEYTCYKVQSDYISTNLICKENDEIIDYRLLPESIKEEFNIDSLSKEYEKELENYKLYTDNNSLFIWSYKGYNYINEDTNKYIKIFDKDIYSIPLATKINNYIIIPDYEQKYNFNKVYIINTDNLELDEWELDEEISFDSYILGYNDRSLFLMDKKNEKEYELVPHKKKMRIVAKGNKKGIIYENGEEKKYSLSKIINDEMKFTYYNPYNYELIDNTLYLKYLDSDIKTKISNNKVDKIININKDEIYYLSKDKLYKYNLDKGEILQIEYSEWEFNNDNSIIINN